MPRVNNAGPAPPYAMNGRSLSATARTRPRASLNPGGAGRSASHLRRSPEREFPGAFVRALELSAPYSGPGLCGTCLGKWRANGGSPLAKEGCRGLLENAMS
ncbi:hypothetical protein GCM10023324_28830 [Streptomyces youssoufiensis]